MLALCVESQLASEAGSSLSLKLVIILSENLVLDLLLRSLGE